MCGRFTITLSIEELMLRYYIDRKTNRYHTPRYNVAPSQMVLAVINDGERNRIGELQWGLIPSWATDQKIGNKMINARNETLLEKASFKNLIYRKRCILPADGFFEWKKQNGKKQPMRITMKDKSIFSMAGLYDTWQREDGIKISTCTIITTKPNHLMRDIHDRMPVILKKEDEEVWLNRSNTNAEELLSLLAPFPAEEMYAYPVSPIVGNVRNDTPECIEQTNINE
jgi:putative SOS response-associated peptidase YedK